MFLNQSTRDHTLPALTRRSVFTLAAGLLLLGGVPGAMAKETIKLGFLGPLSGGSADAGLGPRNAFLLAIEQANASGYPYNVEGVVLDDGADPSVAVSAALKLVNDPKVVAVTGHFHSGPALATTPIFQRYGVPFIAWGTVSPKVTEPNLSMVTRVQPTLLQQNKPLAEWIAGKLGVKKLAVISDTTDYGAGNLAAFSDYYKAAGGTVVSVDSAPAGTTDFRPMLTKLKAQSPEGVYYGGVYTDAAVVRKQMVELGLTVPMFGISGMYDTKLIEIAGQAADGIIVANPKEQSNPKMDAFKQAYQQRKFAEPVGPNARYAYDATNILLTVIRDHNPKDRVQLAKAIRSISYDGVLGRVTFDRNGQTQAPVVIDIFTIKDGRWQPWPSN